MSPSRATRPAEPAPRRQERGDDASDADLWVVPAAVLCAFCGQPDCPGCRADESRSGVLAIVPWERPGGLWSRLWSTANATTRSAETFFGALPDGAVGPPLRFAVLSELLAIASVVAVLLPLFVLALPALALELVSDPSLRAASLRGVAIGIPLLAAWMVVAHVMHGAALDIGARRLGARSQRRRALRFGLYACGWDLMMGPIGAIGTIFGRGPRALAELVVVSMKVPSRASLALLQGAYGLRRDAALRARRAGTAAAVALTVASAVATLAAILAVVL